MDPNNAALEMLTLHTANNKMDNLFLDAVEMTFLLIYFCTLLGQVMQSRFDGVL